MTYPDFLRFLRPRYWQHNRQGDTHRLALASADSSSGRKCLVDMVLMSGLGRQDGGRETWAYGFVPQLLRAEPHLTLRLFCMRVEGGRDNSKDMLAAVAPEDRDRICITMLPGRRSRIPLSLSMIPKLRQHLKSDDSPPPDYVLGIGSVFELLIILRCKRYRRCPKVIWLRNIISHEKAGKIPWILRPAARGIEAAILRRADALLTNGDDIAAHYGKYGLTMDVIRNGVDLVKWAMPEPELIAPLKVAYIGRLTMVKGIEAFLELVAHVKSGDEADAFEFHVIGDGGRAPEVRALQDAGLLKYHGAIANRDVPAALQGFDVCVALTFASPNGGGGGTSNALLEQMAAGRIIVAWDNRIFRQLLGPHNAYLAAQGNVVGLVGQLTEIARDQTEALSKAEMGQRTINDYTLEAQMAKYRDAHAHFACRVSSN